MAAGAMQLDTTANPFAGSFIFAEAGKSNFSTRTNFICSAFVGVWWGSHTIVATVANATMLNTMAAAATKIEVDDFMIRRGSKQTGDLKQFCIHRFTH
jgi:hypothetical protein